MKSLTLILGCLILAALLIPLALTVLRAAPGLPSLSTFRRALGLHTGVLRCNALTSGIHASGKITLLADVALTARHLLVKRGSDASHFALGTASDEPLGICQDEPAAAEDPANVALLGSVPGTVLMVGSEAIDPDETVYAAANGKIQDEPTVVGTYWMVGKAVDACVGDGGQVEVTPCKPVKVVVIANASTLAQTQAAMATPAIVKVL